jgi:hypothetical protein
MVTRKLYVQMSDGRWLKPRSTIEIAVDLTEHCFTRVFGEAGPPVLVRGVCAEYDGRKVMLLIWPEESFHWNLRCAVDVAIPLDGNWDFLDEEKAKKDLETIARCIV